MKPFSRVQRVGVARWFPGAVVNGGRALVAFGEGYPRAEVRVWREGGKVMWESGVAGSDDRGGMEWTVSARGEFSPSGGAGAEEAYAGAVRAWSARGHRTPGGAGGRGTGDDSGEGLENPDLRCGHRMANL